jgi:CRP-like cAMP-binding protein
VASSGVPGTGDATRLLSATALFGALPEGELGHVAEVAVRRAFRRGEYVFHEGDRGHSLFVVADGAVKVAVTSPDGQEMILATLRRPDVFGELAAIDGGIRSASVQALRETTLLAIRRDTLLELLRTRPAVADVLLQALGSLVRRLSGQAADLVFLDLPARVAKLLVGLAAERGTRGDAGVTLGLDVTQATIGAMVGGSRQSVNQALQSLEREGHIIRDARTVVVRDIDGLRRRSAAADAHGGPLRA